MPSLKFVISAVIIASCALLAHAQEKPRPSLPVVGTTTLDFADAARQRKLTSEI